MCVLRAAHEWVNQAHFKSKIVDTYVSLPLTELDFQAVWGIAGRIDEGIANRGLHAILASKIQLHGS